VRVGSLTALVLAVLAVLGGCGSHSATTSSSRPAVAADPELLKGCHGWFGGGVAAALCASDRTGPLTVRVVGGSDRTGSAVGLAQAMGEPLASGAKLELGGDISRGSILLVRVRVGVPGYAGTAWFALPRLRHGGVGTLTLSGWPGSRKAVLDFGSVDVAAGGVTTPADPA
jgi:hypothetical protein